MRSERGLPVSRLRRGAIAGVVLLATVLGGVRPVAAQIGDGTEVRRELERTDRVLEEAGRIVRDAGSQPRAVELLDLATHSQQIAWENFRAGRPRLALDQTRQARELARRAIGLVARPGNGEERARQALERAQHALERARECAGQPPSVAAARLLDIASTRFEQAQAALQEQKYLLTVDLCQQVQRVLEDVCGGIGAAQVERLIETVDQLFERVAPEIAACPDPHASTLRDRAGELLQRAHELMASKNWQLAERAAREARELLLRALRACEQPPDLEVVDRALEATAADLERLTPHIRDAGPQAAVTLLETATEHLMRARDLRRDQQLRQALAETRVARNLAWRAARLAGLQGF
jgi:hypothetical protein